YDDAQPRRHRQFHNRCPTRLAQLPDEIRPRISGGYCRPPTGPSAPHSVGPSWARPECLAAHHPVVPRRQPSVKQPGAPPPLPKTCAKTASVAARDHRPGGGRAINPTPWLGIAANARALKTRFDATLGEQLGWDYPTTAGEACARETVKGAAIPAASRPAG